jgi:hypothetical protein
MAFMGYALQKLPVLVNDLNLSIRNPLLVYSFLALYGVMMLMLIAYVHAKFRTAAKALKRLQTDWDSASSSHQDFVGIARERLAKLQTAPTQAPTPRHSAIGVDIRHQIVAMSKRGTAIQDIARTCGLQESEVDVILGMARLQR